jgi:hypothetical protein
MSKSFFVSDFQAEKSFESTSNEIFDTYSKVKMNITLFDHNRDEFNFLHIFFKERCYKI